jgi:hypothetical protein
MSSNPVPLDLGSGYSSCEYCNESEASSPATDAELVADADAAADAVAYLQCPGCPEGGIGCFPSVEYDADTASFYTISLGPTAECPSGGYIRVVRSFGSATGWLSCGPCWYPIV